MFAILAKYSSHIILSIIDYNATFQTPNISSGQWEELEPTNRKWLNGYSWFFFTRNTVRFLLRNPTGVVLEDQIYYRKDVIMRELTGLV